MQNGQFLLMCRSLTYGQRTVRTLERAGITGTLIRAPRSVSQRGCGYSVIVTARNLRRALNALREAGLAPERIYEKTPDGELREAGNDLP